MTKAEGFRDVVSQAPTWQVAITANYGVPTAAAKPLTASVPSIADMVSPPK